MSAFILAFVHIKNVEAYNNEYMAKAHPIVVKHGGEAIAVTENVDVLEGKLPKGRLALVKFPSMDAANAFYADPDYQPLIAVRQKYTEGAAVLFDQGLVAEQLI